MFSHMPAFGSAGWIFQGDLDNTHETRMKPCSAPHRQTSALRDLTPSFNTALSRHWEEQEEKASYPCRDQNSLRKRHISPNPQVTGFPLHTARKWQYCNGNTNRTQSKDQVFKVEVEGGSESFIFELAMWIWGPSSREQLEKGILRRKSPPAILSFKDQ